MVELVKSVQARFNPGLQAAGILLTMYQSRPQLCRSVQESVREICSIEGYQINKAAMQHIVRRCPPPMAQKQAVFTAWHGARAAAEERLAAPPMNITFRRKRFEPYLEKLGSDRKLEGLFLEFLQERMGA